MIESFTTTSALPLRLAIVGSEPFEPFWDDRAAAPNMYQPREWKAMGTMTGREINLIVYSKLPRRQEVERSELRQRGGVKLLLIKARLQSRCKGGFRGRRADPSSTLAVCRQRAYGT